MERGFCATSNLVIGGSFFQHKRILKATWVSPDLSTENQINHVCIGRMFIWSLQEVRVRRGADVASDHHLLVARLRLKLKRHCTAETCRPQFNTSPLKDTTKLQEFKITLTNKFEVLKELIEDESLEEKWQEVKTVVSTCQEVLGPKKHNHKEWLSTETLKIIEERKRKKSIAINRRSRRSKGTEGIYRS